MNFLSDKEQHKKYKKSKILHCKSHITADFIGVYILFICFWIHSRDLFQLQCCKLEFCKNFILCFS